MSETRKHVFDQERDCPIDERSHYETGYVVVRREDTSRANWERMPYRRLVTQWERKRDA